MELRHLRYVIAVAEELHFGKAAARLHISQPPLSRQIRQLEEELGVYLFRRNKRQVELTEAGRVFVDEARVILSQTEQAKQLAIRTSRGEIGRLKVGITSLYPKTEIVEVLRLFAKRYPKVQLMIERLRTDALIDALRDDRLDVGFLRLPVAGEGLRIENMLRDRLVVAMPEDHSLASRRRVPLSALANETYIMFARYVHPGYHDLIVGLFRDANCTLNVVSEQTDSLVVLLMIAAGLGLAILPVAYQQPHMSGVVFRELGPPVAHVQWAVAYRSADENLVSMFVDVVREVCRRQRRRHRKK